MDEMQVLDIMPVERSLIYVPDVGKALQAWQAYQDLVRKLLDDNDYATIRGKKHRKRGGWSKLRRAFNITTTVVDSGWEDLGDDAFGFFVTVRAVFPDGRCEDGDGYCDSIEMSGGNIQATRHNVRAKAMTRAKNRATSDLIGTGEVSAEEITGSASPAQAQRQRATQPARQRQQAQRKPNNAKDQKKSNGKSWTGELIAALIQAELFKNSYNAVPALNHSKIITPTDEIDVVLKWARLYRKERDDGAEVLAAVKIADDTIKQAMESDASTAQAEFEKMTQE